MSESEADLVYARYRPFLRELYEIWDASVTLAVEDFDERGRDIERFQLANYTRHEAKCRLEDLEGTEFECGLKDLDNNGIEIAYHDAIFKVLRSNNGQLHFPRTTVLGDYFEQGSLPLVDATTGAPIGTDLNLVIGWDFDFATRSLESMDLIRPSAWAKRIEHPVDSGPERPGGGSVDQAPDLDLELDDEDEAEAEGGDK